MGVEDGGSRHTHLAECDEAELSGMIGLEETSIVSGAMKLKAIILKLKKNQPGFYWLICALWFRKHFRINRKRVYGKSNKFTTRGAVLNGVRFDIIGDKNQIEIHSLAILDNVRFHIRGNGNKALIGAECRITDSTIWIEDDDCKIIIGRKTTIGGVHLAVTEDKSKVVIGDDCMLAYDIDIRTGDSHGIYDQSGNRINKAEDVIIGGHVWIAAHATILKGSTIGSDSIVGTGAVVTNGNYPAGSVLAGNPAKLVKRGINWSRSRIG